VSAFDPLQTFDASAMLRARRDDVRSVVVALVSMSMAGCHASQPSQITFDGAQTSGKRSLALHGERLIHVLGCTGCHDVALQGTFLTKDQPQYGPLYASNLSVELPHYSSTQIDGMIRHGVHPQRRTLWGMPSEIFQHLSDQDFLALLDYLRTLKPVGQKLPPPQFSAQDRKDIASGNYKPAAQLVRETRQELPVDLGPQFALGRYIAEVTCAECHGPKLEGNPNAPMGHIPNLIVAGAYSRAEFELLMTRGIAANGRKINPIMAGVARTRFAHFTPHERDALFAYLKARAQRQ
jgi:cytochrome c553